MSTKPGKSLVKRPVATLAAMEPLTEAEAAERGEIERRIAANAIGFMQTAKDLLRMREGCLYRSTHPTFEDYCQDVWDFSRQYANYQIAAAKVQAALTTTVVIPNERVARELTPLLEAPKKLLAAGKELATAPKLTARVAHAAVLKQLPEALRARMAPPPTAPTTDQELLDDSHELVKALKLSLLELKRRGRIKVGIALTKVAELKAAIPTEARKKGRRS